jgi:hypothetical protein
LLHNSNSVANYVTQKGRPLLKKCSIWLIKLPVSCPNGGAGT